MSHHTDQTQTLVGYRHKLRGTISPWTTFSEGMADVERGYSYYPKQYKRNYSRHLPDDKNANILVASAGPGYFVAFLNDLGYEHVLGIDTDPARVEYAQRRNLNVKVAHPFDFLEDSNESYDLIVLEQEINHLTRDEFLDLLALIKPRLKQGGRVALNATNYANPILSPDHGAHNINHFSGWTTHSLTQAFEHAGYSRCICHGLDNYVLYGNPFNYVAKGLTALVSLALLVVFRVYGKNESIFTKRMIAAGIR
jgi:2-polyprenyl-3-methyl-5-hydroxy-6-metoxy-1,4-benzoquinol methylase